MKLKKKIPKTVKLKTYLLTLFIIVLFFASMLNYSLSNIYIGDLTEVYVQSPFHEHSYIVGIYNASYYYAKNSSSGNYDYLSTNATYLTESIINDIGNGESIFFKAGTYNISTVISIAKPLMLQGEIGTIFKAGGDNEIFAIDLYMDNLNSAHTMLTFDHLAFNGSAVTTSTIPLINFSTTANVIRAPIRLLNLKMYSGQRGIAYTSDYIWWAMGSVFQNIQFHNMKASSIYITGKIGDLRFVNVEVYCSFQDASEPYIILNCEGGMGSGQLINGLTILGKKGQSISHVMELKNKAVYINNLIIDTGSGDGLYIEGSQIYIDNFEVDNVEGHGIFINASASWIGLANGRIFQSDKHGLYIKSGSYIQVNNVNFVNNGQEADDSYDDIHIDDATGANVIISATANNAETNRTRYGLWAGTSSYGICNIEATGLRQGAVYLNTTKLWDLTFIEDSKRNKNSGNATGESPITVTHGLAGTPTMVVVTPQIGGVSVAVTVRGATTFEITHSAGMSITVDWYAQYMP